MKKHIGFSILALGLALTSCDDWLDKLPDNRMELHSPDDVSGLLVSAYPNVHPAYLLEMYSDNTDECVNPSWTETDRFQSQAYHWEDITETGDNESPQVLWDSHYLAIASANAAIDFIDEQGAPEEYNEQLGEALLCRAYAMFQLSTVFCKAYNPTTASTDLGLPYPLHTESVVGVTYERGTMEELYSKIDADLQRGLPLISSNYSKPKFHFNTEAANAFAARFYLYKGDFDKAISYATVALGSDPTSKARDWAYYASLGMNQQIRPEAWISADEKCNFLLQTVYSEWGAISGPYIYGDKFAHSYRITYDEDIASKGPFGAASSVFYQRVWSNTSLAKLFHRKIPYEFEYTDVQAGIGYAHAEYAVFTTEQLLLERAEAYALSGNLQKAVDDYNTIMKIFMKSPKTFTLEQIVEFYNGKEYYTPKDPTVKKHLKKPVYTIGAEGSDQEALLQAILHLRRIMELGEGYRMQDVKRYGIVIYRRQTNTSYTISAVTDSLTVDDPRRAIQLPQDVITSGLEPNDRVTVGNKSGNILEDAGYIYEINK